MFENDTDNAMHLTATGQEVPESAEPNPVDRAYGMEARQMLKSISLPTGEIPEELRRQVRQTVSAHIQRHRLTYRTVGAQVSICDSTLSEVLRGKYKGDTDAMLRKLNAWVDDDERRRRRETPLGLYETSILLAVRDAAAIAKKNARTAPSSAVNDERARIVLAYGPSGCGKSVAAKALYASDPNSLLIRLRYRGGTDRGVLKAIVESSDWRGKSFRSNSMTNFVFEKLRHSGRLLIIDQGHHLAHSGYEFLIDLADECGIPILVIGTELIQRKVQTVRLGAGDIYNDQFSRRVVFQMNLLEGSDGQGGSKRPFFTFEEIVGIFTRDTVRLTTEAAEFLQAIACWVGQGMLGQAANLHEKALYTALRRPDKLIDLKLLWRASERILMDPGDDEGWDQIRRQIECVMDANREMEASRTAAAERRAAAAAG